MITTEDIQKARGNEESNLLKVGLLRATRDSSLL